MCDSCESWPACECIRLGHDSGSKGCMVRCGGGGGEARWRCAVLCSYSLRGFLLLLFFHYFFLSIFYLKQDRERPSRPSLFIKKEGEKYFIWFINTFLLFYHMWHKCTNKKIQPFKDLLHNLVQKWIKINKESQCLDFDAALSGLIEQRLLLHQHYFVWNLKIF